MTSAPPLPWSSHVPSIRLFWYDNSAVSERFQRLTVLRQASLEPEQAVNVLNDRVELIKKINNDIADWLQVRDNGAARQNSD